MCFYRWPTTVQPFHPCSLLGLSSTAHSCSNISTASSVTASRPHDWNGEKCSLASGAFRRSFDPLLRAQDDHHILSMRFTQAWLVDSLVASADKHIFCSAWLETPAG